MNSGGPMSPAHSSFLTYVILNDDAPLALTWRRRTLRRMGFGLRAPLDAARGVRANPVDAARPRSVSGARTGLDPRRRMWNGPPAAHRLAAISHRPTGRRRRRA